MFPLLPLDGGHAAIATYERVRERDGRRYFADCRQADAVRDGRDRRAARSCSCPGCTSTSRSRCDDAATAPSPSAADAPDPRRLGRRSAATRRCSVQSMTITKTADVEGTLQQIYALAAAGCDIVRCTCNEAEAAEGLAQIVPRSPVPIIADIHHQYRMALAAMEAGVHGLRLNPGNIRQPEHIKAVASRGARPAGADPHRRQRRLARPRPVREARRPHARGDGRVGAAGDRLLRRGRLRPHQDLGEGVERAVDGRGLPAAVGGHRPPVAPRRHRGRPAAGRGDQGDRRHRHAADGGHRRHHPLLAHRRSGRGGARRAPAARGAGAARAQERRPHRLPVVRPRRDRRDRRRARGPWPRSASGSCRCRSP